MRAGKLVFEGVLFFVVNGCEPFGADRFDVHHRPPTPSVRFFGHVATWSLEATSAACFIPM